MTLFEEGRRPGDFWRFVFRLLMVMGVALAARLSFVWETREVPLARHLIGDAAGYYEWASGIADGDWLGEGTFYQAPLYPYWLAICFRYVGRDITMVRMVQAVCGALACGCLYLGTRRLFGRRAALAAGVMLAVYPPAVFADGIVQKTSVTCLLVCALVWACAWLGGARRSLGAVAVGCLTGLVILTRENAMVWLPVLLLWVWWLWSDRSPARRLGATMGVVLGVGLVLAPVGIRNWVVGGEWSVSTFQAGPNFYIGNHRGADGRYEPLVRGHEEPAFERRDATVLAEQAVGRRLSAREVSRYWMKRTIADIRSDPADWMRLLARKWAMVWNAYEVSDVESQYIYEEWSTLLRILGRCWHFGMLCPLATVGLAATWPLRRNLWLYYALLVSMAVAVAMFYVLARYRFPLVPLLIPFAAVGLIFLWECFRKGHWRLAIRGTGVGVLVAVGVNWPLHDERRLNALAWMNVGVAMARDGEVSGAAAFFRRAVQGFPESAEANNNLGQALTIAGDYAGAIVHYERALRVDPFLMGVHYNLGVALEHVGRTDEARSQYARAFELDPSDADARRAWERLGGSP